MTTLQEGNTSDMTVVSYFMNVPWLLANLRTSDLNDGAWKRSAVGISCKSRLHVIGMRVGKPVFTVLTLPNGTWKRPVWRERLAGVANPNSEVSCGQSSRWLNMACRNKRSDWMNRDLIAATLKCERRLSYSREGHCTRAFAASHIKNLCWSLSKRTRCVLAAPLHTTFYQEWRPLSREL